MNDLKNGLRYGPILLQAGITRFNAHAFMFASFITIGFMIFINIGNTYVLNENLGINQKEQGEITGLLLVVNEIILLIFMPLAGILADRIGRRSVMIAGLLIMALGYIFYPTADSTAELIFYRCIYAIGVAGATGMLGTITQDYPQNESRGRMVGLSSVMIILGTLVVADGFRRLPSVLKERGLDGVTAGQYTFWLVALCIVLSCIVLRLGLKEGTPAKKQERPALKILLRSGFKHAKNPRIALAYFAAFVGRSDLVILGSFTVLWGTLAGLDQGMDAADALRSGTLLFVIANIAALFWSYCIGIIIDKFDRVIALGIATTLAAIGFLSMGLIDNPLDPSVIPLFLLLGIGQVSCFAAAQALIGQEAPAKERGSVIGAFGFCGAAGIMIASAIGGWLFDTWLRSGPFILVGSANLFILITCFWVYRMPKYQIDKSTS
ncbi:MAG: MFS transporter [Pseudomonadota bacterium]|nr:MFS transporter [Pseudomonadota bacterium]